MNLFSSKICCPKTTSAANSVSTPENKEDSKSTAEISNAG